VVISTGTASGKSLAYQLPGALGAAHRREDDRALPVADQGARGLTSCDRCARWCCRTSALPPSTATQSPSERDWVRAHSRLVLTNPDMLHRGILPSHARWATFLRRLKYVVVDECHTYRGVFGSHVSHVLRRLRRICASYGAYPTFVLASATVASRRSRLPAHRPDGGGDYRGRVASGFDGVRAVGAAADRCARRARGAGAAARRRRGGPAARRPDRRGRPRAGLRQVPPRRRRCSRSPPGDTWPAPHRSSPTGSRRTGPGYLAEEGAALEAALANGTLLGVAATNALELGIDIAGLDAVVLAGFPGTLASRCGNRPAGPGVKGSGRWWCSWRATIPLDTYLVHHPDAVFGRPVEATVLDPENPYVLGPQLCWRRRARADRGRPAAVRW
jgi:DEAD/DEAH box helicase domain-containing protein